MIDSSPRPRRTNQRVLRIARIAANEAMASGARAVVLTGSHACGEAREHSDIDIIVIGRGEPYQLERRGGHLVSLCWQTLADCRRGFEPARAGVCVPGWRDAVVLEDPDGVAAAIQRRARAFSWDAISDECDAWVADQITGYA